MGGFRDQGVETVGLGLCKVGGVGSRSNSAPGSCGSAVRTISVLLAKAMYTNSAH